MKTSKQDHEKRAMDTIAAFIANTSNTMGWHFSDRKTLWLQRAKAVGVDGYSAHLRDAFASQVVHTV